MIHVISAATKKNWKVEAVVKRFGGSFYVLVYRSDAPLKDQEYSIHLYDSHMGFYHGQYDMSKEEAYTELARLTKYEAE